MKNLSRNFHLFIACSDFTDRDLFSLRMIFWASLRVRPCFIYHYCGAIRLLSSSASTRTKILWDPTVSLQLNHQTLVLLEQCRSRNHFRQIVAQMMRLGLVGKTFPMSRLIYFSAIARPENLDLAILLFDHYTHFPNLYIYNMMISATHFSKSRSFSLYSSMLRSGICPDNHTLLYLLKASQCVSEVKQIHGHAVVTGVFSYGYLRNSLIKMYMENGAREIAQKVFDGMSEQDVVSFNTMIVGNSKEGFCLEAIGLFRDMLNVGLQADEFTVLGLVVCFGVLRDARLGKSVHSWIERRKCSSSSNLILGNALLDMYVKCKELGIALKIFRALTEKDIVSWNTMISGLAKAGELELASSFFKRMPKKDRVSWNSLISGFSQKGDYDRVVDLFGRMIAENVRPDHVTMVSLVSAAAENGSLDQGKRIHGLVVRTQMNIDAFLGSALLDMYSKCGSIERALSVFKGLTNKDVTTWTAMISGCAFHGYGNKSLDLFSEMKSVVKPNEVTFVAVLTACTHSGLVDQGLRIFHSMEKEFDIEPGIEHYGCLVDLLGRSGRLSEARDVIEKMPMAPSRSIWGAMLSACRARGDMELAEIASTELLKLEPEKESGYVLLSNVYASCEKWKDSDMIREAMESRGVKKTAGCSSIVVDGLVHSFVAADSGHRRWLEIHSILQCLNSDMKLDEISLRTIC